MLNIIDNFGSNFSVTLKRLYEIYGHGRWSGEGDPQTFLVSRSTIRIKSDVSTLKSSKFFQKSSNFVRKFLTVTKTFRNGAFKKCSHLDIS